MAQREDDKYRALAALLLVVIGLGVWGYTSWATRARTVALERAAGPQQFAAAFFSELGADATGSVDADGTLTISYMLNPYNSNSVSSLIEDRFLEHAYELLPIAFAKWPSVSTVRLEARWTHVTAKGHDLTLPRHLIVFDRATARDMNWPKVERYSLPQLAKRYWRLPSL